jgi:hypothetical protein
MSLEQWLRNGWLQPHESTVAEIERLFRVVDRDISDAQAQGLSVEGRFQHAYHAALQLCVIALRASGFRVPKGEGLHKRAIDSLRYTLGDQWSDMADHIERCSRIRGQAGYEGIDVVTQEDADDLLDTARQLRLDALNWLKTSRPKLIPPGL